MHLSHHRAAAYAQLPRLLSHTHCPPPNTLLPVVWTKAVAVDMDGVPERESRPGAQNERCSTSYATAAVKGEASQLKARDCQRCRRPKRVCICSALPEAPLRAKGKVFILQHPHELKKRLATVPVLQLALHDLLVVASRKLQPTHTAAHALLKDAAAQGVPIYFLYPAPGASDLTQVACTEAHTQALHAHATRAAAAEPDTEVLPAYVLVVVDGTWQQAKEMAQLLSGHILPPAGTAQAVLLPPGVAQSMAQPPASASAQTPDQQAAQTQTQTPQSHTINISGSESLPPSSGPEAGAAGAEIAGAEIAGVVAAGTEARCLIRKEPEEGYMSTYQAVVEALGLLEHNPSLRTALLAPLALLTAHQAAFDPAVAARMAGRKEGEEGSWVRGQSSSKAGGKAGVCAGLGGNRFDGQGGQGGDGVGRGSKSRREEVEACDGKEGAKTMKR